MMTLLHPLRRSLASLLLATALAAPLLGVTPSAHASGAGTGAAFREDATSGRPLGRPVSALTPDSQPGEGHDGHRGREASSLAITGATNDSY